jgi:cyclic pyranopterin monophosphate synthase
LENAVSKEGLSHVDANNQPTMVDVGSKSVSSRTALARSVVVLPPEVRSAISGDEIVTKKGPVFQTAIIAGTMAAKKTHDLIPFCHPLGLESCKFNIELQEDGNVVIECEVALNHKTGVEMEALTGVTVAALTIYDMCKALSHDIMIVETGLISKTGGKSDFQTSR